MPVQVENHSEEIQPNSREIVDQQPVIKVEETNIESQAARLKSICAAAFSVWFFSCLNPAGSAWFLLIRYGLFDGYLLSSRDGRVTAHAAFLPAHC